MRAALEDPAVVVDRLRLRDACLQVEETRKAVDRLYARWAELGKAGRAASSTGPSPGAAACRPRNGRCSIAARCGRHDPVVLRHPPYQRLALFTWSSSRTNPLVPSARVNPTTTSVRSPISCRAPGNLSAKSWKGLLSQDVRPVPTWPCNGVQKTGAGAEPTGCRWAPHSRAAASNNIGCGRNQCGYASES